MSIAVETYQSAGLKGLAALYELFPDRLRSQLVTAHAALFREYWTLLTPEEKKEVEQYSFEGDCDQLLGHPSEYESKIQDLQTHYETRRAERVREVANCPPDLGTALLLDFEKAHEQLLQINRGLLVHAKNRSALEQQRAAEAELFR